MATIADIVREQVQELARHARYRTSEGKSAGKILRASQPCIKVEPELDLVEPDQRLEKHCQAPTTQGKICGKPILYAVTLTYLDGTSEGGVGCVCAEHRLQETDKSLRETISLAHAAMQFANIGTSTWKRKPTYWAGRIKHRVTILVYDPHNDACRWEIRLRANAPVILSGSSKSIRRAAYDAFNAASTCEIAVPESRRRKKPRETENAPF
jgi:hypothetical protein